MSHVLRDKEKIVNRVRRIRGQVEAIERALDQGQECAEVLHTVAACRGAIQSLMIELMQSHLAEHVFDDRRKSKEIDALIEAMRMCLR